MNIEHLSASAAKKFNKCNKQYWYKYVDQYDVPDAVTDQKYIFAGNAVHDVIEDMLKSGEVDLDDEEAMHTYLQENVGSNYPDDMEDTVETSLETAAKYISEYVDEITSVEDRWEMDYRGINIVGYADLIDGDTIVDWKTGRSEDKEVDEKIQAAFYIKLFEEEYGELPEMVDFAYLDEGQRSTHKRITDDGEVLWNSRENTYWDDVKKIISQIQYNHNTDEWEANPPEPCYWCDYKYACSDYVGSEDLEERHIDFEPI